MTNDENVVIVGAGVAGMSLAIMLAKHNVHCQVLESRQDFEGSTSGVRISSDGTQILSELNIDSIGEKTEFVNMEFGRTGIVANFKVANKEGSQPAIIVTRLALFEKLMEKAKLLGVKVTTGFKVENVQELPEGVVITSEKGDRVKGRILVGADGVGSLIRKLLNPGAASSKKYAGYLGLGFITENNDEKVEMTLEVHPGQQVGMASCGKVNWNAMKKSVFMWTHFHMSEELAKKATKQTIEAELEQRSSVWNSLLKRHFNSYKANPAGSVLSFSPVYNGSPPLNWYNKHMILIGDAAHPYGPGGQGITMALKDAHALCNLIVHQGFSEEGKKQFRMTRELDAKTKGEAAEERNKLKNQPQTWFGVLWKAIFMKVFQWMSFGVIKM